MKLEKINDSQILCTVTKQDLDMRHIEFSQLSYGSDAVKGLFRDILQQAADELDFHLDSMHLMVEIIPMDLETLEFVITKVSVPEEMDNRFSNYRPSITRDPDTANGGVEGSNLSGILQSLFEHAVSSSANTSADAAPASSGNMPQSSGPRTSPLHTDAPKQAENLRIYMRLNRLFLFDSLSDACKAAKSAKDFTGESALYFSDDQQVYSLVLRMKDKAELAASQKVIAALSEYGTAQVLTPARLQSLQEHGNPILEDHAIQKLSEI